MSEDSNLIQDSFGIMVRKATEGVEEGVKGKAVAGNKKIFLYNIQSKLSSLDEARGMAALFVERIQEHADSLQIFLQDVCSMGTC